MMCAARSSLSSSPRLSSQQSTSSHTENKSDEKDDEERIIKAFQGSVRISTVPVKSWRLGSWVFYKKRSKNFLRVIFSNNKGALGSQASFSLADLKHVPIRAPMGTQLTYEFDCRNGTNCNFKVPASLNESAARKVLAEILKLTRELASVSVTGFSGTKKSLVSKVMPQRVTATENDDENRPGSSKKSGLVTEALRRQAVSRNFESSENVPLTSRIPLLNGSDESKENLNTRISGPIKRFNTEGRAPLEDIRADLASGKGINPSSFYSTDSNENFGNSMASQMLFNRKAPSLLNPRQRDAWTWASHVNSSDRRRRRRLDDLNQISRFNLYSYSSTTPQKRASNLKGFSNLGNTCYMNAILQSLFAIDPFAKEILKLHDSIVHQNNATFPLLKALVQLLVEKNSVVSEDKERLLRGVKLAISSTAERFSGNIQQDAHEFLVQVLEQLKSEIEGLGERAEKNPVQDNIEFTVRDQITCLGCNDVIEKVEESAELPLCLPVSTGKRNGEEKERVWSVCDLMGSFFEKEFVDHKCDKCNTDNALITHRFGRLPRVLVIYLKRFSFDAVLAVGQKLVEDVEIPKYISLDFYSDSATQQTLPLPQSTKKVELSFGIDSNKDSSSFNLGSAKRKLPFSSASDEGGDSSCSVRMKQDDGGGENSKRSRVSLLEEVGENEDEDLKKALELSLTSDPQVDEDEERFNKQIQEAVARSLVESSLASPQGKSISDVKKEPSPMRSKQEPMETDEQDESLPAKVEDVWMGDACGLERVADTSSSLEVLSESQVEVLNFSPVDSEWQAEKCLLLGVEMAGVVECGERVELGEGIVPCERVRIEGDGNCFFRALSYWVTGTQEYFQEMREKVLSYLFDNHGMVFTKFEGVDWDKLSDHFLEMSKDGEWATHTEILAAACLLQTDIYTYTKSGSKYAWLRTRPSPLLGEPETLWNGGRGIYMMNSRCHYEPVLSVRDKNSPEEACLDTQDAEKKKTEEEERLKSNEETGELPNSYRLSAVINHSGSSNAGHYYCDVRDFKDGGWKQCDDKAITRTTEEDVRRGRMRSAYILFYVNKKLCEESELSGQE